MINPIAFVNSSNISGHGLRAYITPGTLPNTDLSSSQTALTFPLAFSSITCMRGICFPLNFGHSSLDVMSDRPQKTHTPLFKFYFKNQQECYILILFFNSNPRKQNPELNKTF